jgi:biopolymer transport protein ExbB
MNVMPGIVNLVLWILGILSIVVWTIAIAKFINFYQSSRRNRKFLAAFAKASNTQNLDKVTDSEKGTLARINNAGLDELRSLQRSDMILSVKDKREILLHALQQQAYIEKKQMESGLGVLASIGSTAPFIGLFGTVWGIMHALKDISATGSAGLDVVAGPIGEALIATAIGIATAVPAVLAYNYFLHKVKSNKAQMENFGSAFQNLTIKSGLSGD